jgi:hypothetical protein
MDSMILNSKTTEQPNILFDPNSRWLKICLVVMFLIAALIRRDEIKAPGHLIEREYNSAIFARAYYMNGNDKVEQWQKDIAFAARDQLPTLEPPLTEFLVSLIYRIVGREEIWYARYLTGLFWLIGGVFLYKTVQSLVSVDGALIAVGYYLFAPWGIIISRSFQPDALMMMLFLISLHGIVTYFEKPTWHRLLLAGVVTGITLLLRPLVVFTLFGAFTALSIHKKGRGLHVFDKQFLVFIFLSLVFPLAFYGYGIYVAGFLQGQADLSFRPYLLTRWEFWMGWLNNSAQVAGHPFLLLAVFGFILLRDKLTRFLIAGLAFGYFFFGLFFTFHIHTHPYYHIQLLPFIGICIAPILVVIGNALKKTAGEYWRMPVLAGLLLAIYFSSSEVRGTLYKSTFEDPRLASEIGEVVNHSQRSVFVAYHYGLPLEYYGQISGVPWPVSIDDPLYRRPDERELSVQERMNGLGFAPEYFIITHFELFNRKHQDLKVYLQKNCTTLAQTDRYLIYGSCQSLTSSENLLATSALRSGN